MRRQTFESVFIKNLLTNEENRVSILVNFKITCLIRIEFLFLFMRMKRLNPLQFIENAFVLFNEYFYVQVFII